jgi:hypothetical protein
MQLPRQKGGVAAPTPPRPAPAPTGKSITSSLGMTPPPQKFRAAALAPKGTSISPPLSLPIACNQGLPRIFAVAGPPLPFERESRRLSPLPVPDCGHGRHPAGGDRRLSVLPGGHHPGGEGPGGGGQAPRAPPRSSFPRGQAGPEGGKPPRGPAFPRPGASRGPLALCPGGHQAPGGGAYAERGGGEAPHLGSVEEERLASHL